MKKVKALAIISILLFFCIAASGTVSFAQDPIMDKDQLRLRDQIHKDTGLSKNELDSLNEQLREHLRLRGSGQQVRSMIRESLNEGCKGDCLRDCITAMNRTMSQGYSEKEARDMVMAEMRIQTRERERLRLNNDELGNRILNRVEDQLKFRNKMMKEKKIRMREHEMSPMRERSGMGPESGGRR